jgi:enolase
VATNTAPHRPVFLRIVPRTVRRAHAGARAYLQEGWVIANHILVSFHVAFISSVLSIPEDAATREGVLRFIFTSPETLVSAIMTYLVFHSAISLHELGHFMEAARLRALNDSIQEEVSSILRGGAARRFTHLLKMFLLIPFGRATGVKREGLNYYPDAPYNLAVAAAGPRASLAVAGVALPLASILLGAGLSIGGAGAVYAGRLLLGLGLVTLLDFLIADPGKYREFRRRERLAKDAAASVDRSGRWADEAPAMKKRIVERRMQRSKHPRLGAVAAPWQFRNCGMGGRHTEKEYPESNVSMQEAMFLILGAVDTQEAQEMTVRLQNRLKEILESADGCRVMGIGLEGGLAPYVDRGSYELPELRLWAMMRQAIEDCGYRPGLDVALALDPAMSELEIAYREEFDMPDSVGMYLFWRDRSSKVMDRDAVLSVYEKAIFEYDIPILSIEDGFSEDDAEGWRMLLDRLGDRILVVGDDLVTTNDRTIERAASSGLINSVLIKANQIGSLYETLLAVLVTLGKGLQLIVSHRSKSPNDDMEAHIALATNALGLKAGGGANTERLIKYQAVATQMERVLDAEVTEPQPPPIARVERLRAREEPTNAGIPTVGVDLQMRLPGAEPDSELGVSFHGATPLGTSAGTGEAVHLVDRGFEGAEFVEVVKQHGKLLIELEPGVYGFKPDVSAEQIRSLEDESLLSLYRRTQRYGGMGCRNAVDHVHEFVAPLFEGQNVAGWGLLDLDRALLELEFATARRRGKVVGDTGAEQRVAIMQRKQNLGMNAILSTSLAMARGIAQVRGQELYEFLREELLLIIERLAAAHRVPIEGSRFSDYLAALREVDRRLETEDLPLWGALRDVTGLYRARSEPVTLPAPSLPRFTMIEDFEQPFSEQERTRITELNQSLADAFGEEGSEEKRMRALRRYLETMTFLGQRYRMFEIANHRFFQCGDDFVMPFDAHGRISIYAVSTEGQQLLKEVRVPHGTLITDAMVSSLCGMQGEPVDLEREIYELHLDQMPAIQVTRLRDLAQLLRRLNTCGSRHEAVYLLRFVVARLCSTSYRGMPGSKNLRPEISRVRRELVDFMNGPFARRLRLPTRVLVRSISGLVSQPKMIDEVWQDTIDLAEVHVQGSPITNEIRRSTHHAMGRHTLRLAEAYLNWLETGRADFPEPGREIPSPADQAARGRKEVSDLVGRIVSNLKQLLGSSQIIERLNDWRDSYARELVLCESGNTLQQELDSLVENGVRARNRWVYQHRLRSLASKARDGRWHQDVRAPFESEIRSLQEMLPDDDGADLSGIEKLARSTVSAFSESIERDHQAALFKALDELQYDYRTGAAFEAFERSRDLRRSLEQRVGDGVFRSQRYLLHQLDCLLEEMGYFALRHIASSYMERGLDLDQCLRIVHLCAGNLERDGLFSRELWDLSSMLVAAGRSPSESLDVLEQVQRNYHRLVRRVSEAYEVMASQLGYGDEDMRAVLGNFQRTMHDLNSLVHFADLARTHLSQDGTGEAAALSRPVGDQPWDFLHLSHSQELFARVEDRQATSLRGRFGGKGSGLIYISYLGIPTRDAFIIPTALPRLGLHRTEPDRLKDEVLRHLRILEADIAANDGSPVRLGDPAAPLLLAVRGGSVFSMPGMLATVVFVGMTDAVTEALAREDEWYAWDACRRFLASFAAAVWNMDLEALDLVEKAKTRHGVGLKTELPGSAMREVVERSREAIREAGHGEQLDAIMADAELQLQTALQAVHGSWDRQRAKRYRAIKHLSDRWHTAVIVQQMASGNRSNEEEIRPGMDETRISLTGVIPMTEIRPSGFRRFTGDVKFSASGDDLVGGLTAAKSFEPVEYLSTQAPMLERKLNHVSARLRRFLGSDAEIEFTVERGVLSVLQARSAEIELHHSPKTFSEPGPPDGRGIGISGGAYRGLVAFNEADVERLTASLDRSRDDVDGVLLVLENPVPDEIPLILSVDGLLSARGGSTSHAAVAVHGIDDRPYTAVLGVGELHVRTGEAVIAGTDGEPLHTVRAGDILSIHGQTGEVFKGTRTVLSVREKQQTTAAAPTVLEAL